MSLTLKETAYQTIREKLISGEYPPGSRISDDLIAREIGVSRSPVREAINQFVSEGLAEYRPRCGTYVRTLSTKELDDLWGVRIALESYAAMEAADNATEEQVRELIAVNDEILELVQTCRELPDQLADDELKKQFMALDSKFHLQLLNSAKNEHLLKTALDCRLMTHIFGTDHARLQIDASMLMKCHRDHVLIVKAIQNSDRDNAREWTVGHIRSAHERVLSAI